MKRNTIITTIGKLDFTKVTFLENTITVLIDIDSVSDEIQKKINQAVELAKVKQLQTVKEHYIHKELTWCAAGVYTDLSLCIIAENHSLSCSIEIDITDKENGCMWTDASIPVDLSDYQNELKKLLLKAMIDNFF